MDYRDLAKSTQAKAVCSHRCLSGPPWGGISIFLEALVLNRVKHWKEKMAKLGHKPPSFLTGFALRG